MDTTQPPNAGRLTLRTVRRALWRLLDLRSDQAAPDMIDAAVRDNARLGGTNLWVLMLAIVVASVGLNVNSTAVIIGAMLISPLMGPIIGVGYGAAVQDHRLIRSSLGNLAVFMTISLLASTVYFALSPLTHAQSEILARTSPTLWDVLIAFFGGAAGMIGLTRKEKTTLIPGVAIATALMPPLCTAGYGLATGQFRIFAGAFYLFLINGVFIALASLTVVRLLRLPRHVIRWEDSMGRSRAVIAAVVLAVLVPSVVLAFRLVEEEVFAANAARFVREVEQVVGSDVVLLGHDLDARRRSISLTLMGKGVTPEFEKSLQQRLASAGLAGATLRVRHPSEEPVKVDALKRDLRQELLGGTLSALEAQAVRIDRLEQAQEAMRTRAAELAAAELDIRALMPGLRRVIVSSSADAGASAGPTRMVVAIDATRRLSKADLDRLRQWLNTRWPGADVELIVGRSAT